MSVETSKKSISEVSKELQEVKKEAAPAVAPEIVNDVLSKPNDTKIADQETKTKDETRSAKVTASMVSSSTRTLTSSVPRDVSDVERAVNRVQTQLDKLLTESNEADRVKAWQRIVETISVNAKKNVMDVIYTFFSKNINNPKLNEMNALQGIERCDKNNRMRIELIYITMRDLTSSRKSRINVDVIRDTYKNEDLVNWVVIAAAGMYRR